MAETTVTETVEAASSAPPDPWAHLLGLPCELSVDLVLRGFKLGDVLQLDARSVINSHWRITADVPLRVNGALIAWTEFEVVGNHLAVRITELA